MHPAQPNLGQPNLPCQTALRPLQLYEGNLILVLRQHCAASEPEIRHWQKAKRPKLCSLTLLHQTWIRALPAIAITKQYWWHHTISIQCSQLTLNRVLSRKSAPERHRN